MTSRHEWIALSHHGKERGLRHRRYYSSRHYTFQRWLFAAQNDWASRADWCIALNYGDANHQPDAQVVGDLEWPAAPGSTVTLNASPGTDPDGNNLTFKWWQYHEVDSANAQITINNDTSQIASFVVANESGGQVHIILEVMDDGTPDLIRYRRIICNINQ